MNQPSDRDRDRLRQLARNAMVARGLEPEFSPAARSQLAALMADGEPAVDEIRDLRELPWCSIDNDDSRDLDQLSVGTGEGEVLVAIADVDVLVAAGTPIDDHARTNTTSVYTAAQIFPMLPPELSTDRTSLNEGEERLAMVIKLAVDASGALTGSDVFRARVRNQAKLAYDGVAAWLDGKGPMPAAMARVPGLDDNLRRQDRVARLLRGRRHEAGALSLQTTEARPVFDGDRLTDLRPVEANRAKELIEELMVAANGVTARLLDSRGFPSLRRMLRSPERWQRMVDLAVAAGDSLPAEPSSAALEALLQRRRAADPLRFPDFSLAVVKLLGRGEYAVERPGSHGAGHFGLAVRDYTHSTAPNRRFPDLVTQRLLKAALTGRGVPYDMAALEAIARQCTVREDAATKVERQVRKSAAALLLQHRMGERFDGVVTGASQKGTWVRIFRPAAEGRVVRGEGGLDVGDRVTVELVSADVERGFIDFAAVAR